MPRTLNIREARRQLSRLVEQAARGESFIIARAGKPLVKVVPLAAAKPGPGTRALGGLAGIARIPADIKSGFGDEIAPLFGSPAAAPVRPSAD